MTMTFYWISGSPYAWRAMLALEHKGLPYESKRLDPSKAEHKTPEYLAVNPRGKVPALTDGDTSIYESLAITEYVERLQPEPNLLGTSASEAAAITQCISELDNYTFDALMGIVRPVLFLDSDPQLSDLEEAVSDSHTEFRYLENRLSASDYLASNRFTAADIAFVPVLEYVLRAAEKQTLSDDGFGFLPLADRYPNIAAWRNRIVTVPAYDKAYPPHWR